MESSENGRGPPKESSDEQPSSNRGAPPPPRDAPPPQQDTPPPPRDGPPPPQQDAPPPPRDASPPQQDAPPVPPHQPPHMMYYPTPMGYPGGYGGQPYPPPGYPPYPTEYPPHHQSYDYPHPPTYYGPPQTYTPSRKGGGFIRGCILCFCVMFTAAFVTILVMALVLHPEYPIYKVVSLSVEDFNTTAALAGKWNTVITVENPNEKLRGFFSDFKVDLLYQRDGIARGYAPGFELGKHEKKQLEVKASSSNVANVDLDGMANERGTGSITLTVRISSLVAFKSSSISTRGEMAVATCKGLKVVFQNNSGNGTLDNGGKPIDCQLYI